MQALMNPGAPLTMSSREIAELTGKRHDHVTRDIRAYVGAVLQMERGMDVRSLDWDGKEGMQVLGDTPIPGVTFTLETNAQNGQKYPLYHLDKSTTLTIVAGYNVTLRKRIIDRWLELEAGAAPALNLRDPKQMAAVAVQLLEVNQELQAQIEAQRPRLMGVPRLGPRTEKRPSLTRLPRHPLGVHEGCTCSFRGA